MTERCLPKYLRPIHAPVDPRGFALKESRVHGTGASGKFISLRLVLGDDLATWLNRCWWPRLTFHVMQERIDAAMTILSLVGKINVDSATTDLAYLNREIQENREAARRSLHLLLCAELEGVSCHIATRERLT